MQNDTATTVGPNPPSNPSEYFSTRYTEDPNRSKVWSHIARFLQRYIPESADLLELGAGYCDFSNNIKARSKTAMDLDPQAVSFANSDVRFESGDCSDLSRFDSDFFDVVFASNLLEHLNRAQAENLVGGAKRVLRPGGRLILMQPNFRLRPREYFDDYTHVAIYTDRSLPDFLTANGFDVYEVKARFLPLTMKSRSSNLHFLVPIYLRLPIKPLAGQMLVVAKT